MGKPLTIILAPDLNTKHTINSTAPRRNEKIFDLRRGRNSPYVDDNGRSSTSVSPERDGRRRRASESPPAGRSSAVADPLKFGLHSRSNPEILSGTPRGGPAGRRRGRRSLSRVRWLPRSPSQGICNFIMHFRVSIFQNIARHFGFSCTLIRMR